MFKKQITKRISHTSENIMAVVLDIENYPVFINFLPHAKVLRKTKNNNGNEIIVADITLKYKIFKINRKCTIEVDRNACEIKILNTDSGTFLGKIKNDWRFKQNADKSTDIDFIICMDIKSKLLRQLVERKADKLTEMMINAFITRTNKLYKK